jgi:hypothetical protein
MSFYNEMKKNGRQNKFMKNIFDIQKNNNVFPYLYRKHFLSKIQFSFQKLFDTKDILLHKYKKVYIVVRYTITRYRNNRKPFEVIHSIQDFYFKTYGYVNKNYWEEFSFCCMGEGHCSACTNMNKLIHFVNEEQNDDVQFNEGRLFLKIKCNVKNLTYFATLDEFETVFCFDKIITGNENYLPYLQDQNFIELNNIQEYLSQLSFMGEYSFLNTFIDKNNIYTVNSNSFYDYNIFWHGQLLDCLCQLIVYGKVQSNIDYYGLEPVKYVFISKKIVHELISIFRSIYLSNYYPPLFKKILYYKNFMTVTILKTTSRPLSQGFIHLNNSNYLKIKSTENIISILETNSCLRQEHEVDFARLSIINEFTPGIATNNILMPNITHAVLKNKQNIKRFVNTDNYSINYSNSTTSYNNFLFHYLPALKIKKFLSTKIKQRKETRNTKKNIILWVSNHYYLPREVTFEIMCYLD